MYFNFMEFLYLEKKRKSTKTFKNGHTLLKKMNKFAINRGQNMQKKPKTLKYVAENRPKMYFFKETSFKMAKLCPKNGTKLSINLWIISLINQLSFACCWARIFYAPVALIQANFRHHWLWLIGQWAKGETASWVRILHLLQNACGFHQFA